MAKIKVQNTEITVVSFEERDYISLTDMVKPIENGLALIEKWLRNKNTIEFLGIWEEIYNHNFNCTEFGTIRNAVGSNNFVLSVKFVLSLAFFCFLTEIIWWNHYYFVFLHR